MIKGAHAMFYSSQADELRAFFRDQLALPATDVGGGWLIMALPEADLGVHPTGQGGAPHNTHDVSFYTDDLATTVAEMKARGVRFAGEIEDHGYGLVTYILAPGDLKIQLYQPRYQIPR